MEDEEFANRYFPNYPGVDEFTGEESPTGSSNVVFRSSSFTPETAEEFDWSCLDEVLKRHQFTKFDSFGRDSDKFSDDFTTMESPIYAVPRRQNLSQAKVAIEMETFRRQLAESIISRKDLVTDLDGDYVQEFIGESEAIVNLTLWLRPQEIKFGFTVVGGCDDIWAPFIDDIAPGSPADRDELEIGDEILEVNGKNLENYTHAEVISFIHSCINSRCIRLKVKRKRDNKSKVPPLSQVQDAYIIAVEDEAKKRLEKLSAAHQVTPVDMTKLSVETSSASTSKEHSSDLPQFTEYHPTSMPVSSKADGHLTNGHVEISNMNGIGEMEVSRKGKGKGKKSSGKNSRESSTGLESILIENVANGQSPSSLDSSWDEFSSSQYDDPGPHREMAIDVPEDFQGSVKLPPRYPPPSTQSSTHSNQSWAHSPNKKSNPNKNNGMVDYHVNPGMNSGQKNLVLKEDQIERLKKHEEDLQKRREEEMRRAKEDEFLRTSVRGSKKLQALKNKNKNEPPAGVVNTAFDDVDDENGADTSGKSDQLSATQSRILAKEDLFACLKHISLQLDSEEDKAKLAFIKNLFNRQHFKNALSVHNKVVDVSSHHQNSIPASCQALEVADDVHDAVSSCKLAAASELVDILEDPHFQGLLQAHDTIGYQKSKLSNHVEDSSGVEVSPSQPQVFGEGSVRIVQLEKTTEPLGATVKNEDDAVVIGRIVKGGIAEKSGSLHEGDEILEINGVDMKGRNINEVSDMLADMTGLITLMIIPAAENYARQPANQSTMHLKALFNYDPTDDVLIPCRELGISFIKGDILHVINQDDPNWWQAFRDGEQEQQTLAGLIPSSRFREQVELSKRALAAENKENEKQSRSCSCGSKERRRKRKRAQQKENEDEILAYEELVQYFPQPNRKRPIVLIGPPNVGRHELRQKLMESDYERFAAAIPHTSRNPSPHEVDGRDYHFVPRAIFEADIASHKFIEHGEFQKNLYGTRIDAVRQVINQGKICILNLHAESLSLLRSTDLKPYIILVYPQNMEKLRQIQQRLGQTRITDEDLKDTVEKAREMEDKYGEYIDFILINSDMDRAYSELLAEINRLEVEPQWVPSVWLR